MRKRALQLMLLMLVSMRSIFAYGQEKNAVTGVVRDSTGATIPNVTVTVKGTKKAVSADADGSFRIVVPSTSSILVFSSVGYDNKEVTAGSGQLGSVVLTTQHGQLSEVVVTGFGIRKSSRKVTYATTEVKGADIVATNTTNIGDALEGKVAGVAISQGSNGPSSSSRITIRGNARLNGNTEPLVVLDGILITPAVGGTDSYGGNEQDFGNILKDLNPDDYESITVLKGSAATALYGQQALNGVLLITSKKGKARKGIGVSVSHTESFQKAYKMLDLQNEFGGGLNPTFAAKNGQGIDIVDGSAAVWPNPNGGYSYGPKLDGHIVQDLDGRLVPWVANNPLKDFYQTGRYMSTNVAAEGGNENTTLRFSYTNVNSGSIMPNNGFNKNTFALRGTQKLSQAISLDASINYTSTKVINPIPQGGNLSPVIAFTEYMPRNAPIAWWKNNYTVPGVGGMKSGSAGDPYGLASILWPVYKDYTGKTENTLLANVDLNAKINSWLSLLVRGNVTAYNDISEVKNPGAGPGGYGTGWVQSESFLFGGGVNGGDTYNYGVGASSYTNTLLSATLTANRDLSKNLVLTSSLGVQSYNELGGPSTFSNTSGGLITPGLYFLGNSVSAPQTSADKNVTYPTKTQDAIYLFGDLTYKDMLTMSYSLRQDYSSTLTYADGHGTYKYLYPMVGFAWTFTELPAFKNMSKSAISYGKLRASLGYSGHDADAYYTNSTGYYGQVGGYNPVGSTSTQNVYGFNGSTLGNLHLKNELAREYEFGADIRFFNNRLGVDVAWYKKNAFNQILPLNVDQSSGVGSIAINAGNIQNQGVEIQINGTPIKTKNFTWDATLTFTRNRNEVISLYPGVSSYTLAYAFGADVQAVASPGKRYGEVMTGFGFATYQAKDANGNPTASSLNGMRVIGNTGYGTDNGPTGGTYTYMRSQDYNGGSQKDLGSVMPDFLTGTVQTFTYKSFSLMFQVDAKVGGLLASATDQYGMETGDGKNSLPGRNTQLGGIAYLDNNGNQRYDGIIPNGVLNNGLTGINGVNVGGMTYAAAVKAGYLKPIPAYEYYENLTDWSSGIRAQSIFDNSFVSLRQVSVGYTLPKGISKRLHLNSARVAITGRNICYIWKDAKDGVNPEGLSNNNAAAFFEYGGLPMQRNIGATINASF